MSNQSASIVIPNLNGMEYLPTCIPSILRAFQEYPGDHEIIVVDNGSTDGGLDWLTTQHATVTLIEMGQNTGFAGACNEGVTHCRNDIVILLNNDTFVRKDFLRPLLEHFGNDESLFAVGCRLVDWHTGKFQLGRRFWRSEQGIVRIRDDKQDSYHSTCASGAICGSACAISRNLYINLGGFGPFHRWNDIDLSYRARKRGLKILYEPRSVVHHVGMATDRKVWSDNDIWMIWRKEMFLVNWRNTTDTMLLLTHVLLLPLTLKRHGPIRTVKSLLKAIRELPAVRRFRISERPNLILTDAELFRNGS